MFIVGDRKKIYMNIMNKSYETLSHAHLQITRAGS